VINYYAKNVTDTTKAKITILDKNRKVIRTYATDSKEDKLEISKGMNSFNWNLQYPEAEKIDGMILWNGVPGNIIAPPGNYFAKIMVGIIKLPRKIMKPSLHFFSRCRANSMSRKKALKMSGIYVYKSMISPQGRARICLRM
jgi:hypothetical protein